VILSDVETFIRRFVVLPSDHEYVTAVVWAAHTWLTESLDVSPRLAIISEVGQYGVGKTRAMEVEGIFCRRFRLELDPTGPALAAMIAQIHPTIGIDETDTIFGARGSANAKQQLRGILNAGYKAGAKLTRRSKNTFVEDVVYGPVMFAGAANLPESLMSRSIVWHMRRRRPEEKIEAWFPRIHVPEGLMIADSLAQWAGTIARDVATAWPDLPDGIEDRASEIWWPLIAIGDAAGGDWPQRIRAACCAMVLREEEETKAPPATQLLADILSVWPVDAAGDRAANAATARLLEGLTTLDGAPWAHLWPEEAAPRELAALLSSRGVATRKVKVDTARGIRPLQGYRLADILSAVPLVPEVPAIEEVQPRV
jgi:hypothetical protein